MDDKPAILKRFFQNRYSRSDYHRLKKLLSAQDPEFEQLMQAHWNEFHPEGSRDLTEVLTEINRRLDKGAGRDTAVRFLQVWSRVAAVLLLPLLVAATLVYLQLRPYRLQEDVFVEVSSPAGARTSLNLPDGSRVWLNGNSSIRYPGVFDHKERRVKMTGEAFFKVSSDPEHPFLVEAGTLTVQATGTEFNVQAYPGEDRLSVILKEGKVAVLDPEKSVLQHMQAGYRYEYDHGKAKGQYIPANAESYSDWINGRLVFENATMEEVMERLKRWYGVQIEVTDNKLLDLHFKATFINESIDEALKLLQSTATFNYRFANREIAADGIPGKAKIVISSE